MPWVDARGRLPGERRHQGAYVDIIAHCTCGRKVRFPHGLAVGIWPLSWRQRDIARTLVCMKCLGTHVAVLFRDATPSEYAVSQHVSDIPDVSAADIMIWYTAALWWKSMLVSGRLPPVIEVDLGPATNAWDIDKVWAHGIRGAPSIAEIEADPAKWGAREVQALEPPGQHREVDSTLSFCSDGVVPQTMERGMIGLPADCVTIDSFSNIEEASAFYEGMMLEIERKRALEAGEAFDPDAPDVRERVEFGVCEALDGMGMFDPMNRIPGVANARPAG